jgi:hypothetical protein
MPYSLSYYKLYIINTIQMIVISRERRKSMCHPPLGGSSPMANTRCGCDCSCPVLLSIDDEIRMLENTKKMMQDRIEAIDRKVLALKSVKPS